MSTPIFSGDTWTKVELKDFLKKIETMYAGNIRQSTFKDQTIIFSSTAEMRERITALRDEICRRDKSDGTLTGNSATQKKIVRITSRNKGFCA